MKIEEARVLVERQPGPGSKPTSTPPWPTLPPMDLFISPGGRWRGPAEIRTAVQAFFESAGEVKVEITRVLVDGDQGAAEWTWTETRLPSGSRHTAEDSIIFEVRDGKIVYWREYFDTANF